MEKIIRGISALSHMVEIAINRVTQNLDFENTLPGRNINDIIDNPKDMRIIDDAVEDLKRNGEKSKEVTLSDNEKLTISIS